MNNVEARELLKQHLARYKTLPYDELFRRVGQVETAELTAPGGQTYQLEVEVIRDAGPGGMLLVHGAIDDGGWRSFCPLTESFFVEPGAQAQRG
jgi:hypothetical protein